MKRVTRWVALLGGAIPAVVAMGVRRWFSEQEPFPLRADHDEATVLGSRVRYRRTEGNGPSIVLVHGYNLSIEDWDPITDLLQGREVIELDLVGFGGSDRPTDLAYDLECQHRYLLGFMDEVGIDQAVLVGHSIGGAVAAGVAARSPERVVGTVLLAPAGVPGTLLYLWPKRQLCRPGLANRIAFKISTRAWFIRAHPNRLVRQYLGLAGSFDEDFTKRLGDIRSPMLVAWSTGDDRCSPEYAEVYRDRVADVEIRMLSEETGHLIPVVDPVTTAALIGEFVDRLGAQEN